MMTIALMASLLLFVSCISGPVAAVAATRDMPITAVTLGIVAVVCGTNLYDAVPMTVGPLGLISSAAGIYAIVRAFRGANL